MSIAFSVALVGLDNAGKTTLMASLKNKKVRRISRELAGSRTRTLQYSLHLVLKFTQYPCHKSPKKYSSTTALGRDDIEKIGKYFTQK